MNSKAAIDLLKEVGIYRLIDFDGCLCGGCEIQGISIDISCRKSSGGFKFSEDFHGTTVRVHSRHLDSSFSELQEVANEVVGLLKSEAGERGEIGVRLCEYEMDKESTCVWCNGPRSDASGYYCAQHAVEKPCG